MRLRLARLEGAAKRLLDVLGHPADSSKEPDATLEALRAAADDAETAEKKPEVSSQKSEWVF